MSHSSRTSHIVGAVLRQSAVGVGLFALSLVGIALALVLALAMRTLAPLLLGPAIIGLVAVLVWREIAARRREGREALALRPALESAPGTYHGLALPDDASLDDSHTWVRASDGPTAAIGVDDLALRLLGPVERVTVAPVGAHIERGQALFVLRRGERFIEVRSPVSGRVRAHNASALQRPALINTSPYEHGWVVSLDAPELARQRGALRDPPSAWAWFRAEVDRALATLAPGGPMPAMPDGGLVSPDLHQLIDDETWTRIRAEFFERPERRS